MEKGMDRNIADQFIEERLSPKPLVVVCSALDAVDEFDDGHDRQTDLQKQF